MRIVDLNEGPLDLLKKAGASASNAISGVTGAMQSKSKDPDTKAKGKRKLKKASIKRSQSTKGQRIKREKMVNSMLKAWSQRSNGILKKEQRDANLKEFNKWIAKFMGGRDIGEPYNGKIKEGPIKKYLATLVKNHMGTDAPTKATTAYPSQQDADFGDEPTMPNMIGKDAQAKALAAPAQKQIGQDPKQKALAAPQPGNTDDAISAFKNLGNSDAEAAMLVRRAAANGANMNDVADIVQKGYQKENLEYDLMTKYLAEAGPGKNTHMEHLEDLVFNHGYNGAEQAIDYITQVVSMLSDGTGESASITTKWDGAPTIVCGIDPSDGKFFVGTKTVFNLEPKLVKNAASLKKYYGDRPDLMEIMGLALKVLPKLGIGGVMQGDFMFARDTIEQETINGEKMISFTPNTITYAVPAKSDLAARILRAKMGIVFHTAYEGADLASMQARFGVDVSGLNQSKEVWVDDATFKDITGKATLAKDELRKIANTIKAMEATMAKIRPEKFNVVIENKEFSKFIKPFINQLVREGKTVGTSTQFLNDFLDFYKGKIQIEIDKISAEKGPENVGIQNRIAKMQKKEEFLEDNSNAILGVLAIYKRIVELKLLIINKLHQVDGLHTFVKDGDSYKVTNPEGFVAIRQDGGAIKLVDRLEFSKQNFNAAKNWKK